MKMHTHTHTYTHTYIYIYIYIYIYTHTQCNPDIREISELENKYLISGFGLFCLGNTGFNLGLEKISLISRLYIVVIFIFTKLYLGILGRNQHLYAKVLN